MLIGFPDRIWNRGGICKSNNYRAHVCHQETESLEEVELPDASLKIINMLNVKMHLNGLGKAPAAQS